MKVLALTSYPVQAAATRYRLVQYVAPLAERGIELDVRPFLNARLFATLYERRALPRMMLGLLNATARRFGDVVATRAADVVLVQREAMILGPPVIEWLSIRLGNCPMVLDLDDATYVPYSSPNYGRLGSLLKWFAKTDQLIRWARVVTCGNRSIAEHVTHQGTRAIIIPTVVDTDRFQPADRPIRNDPPVLGWVGTYSTYPYLESIFPALERLARIERFHLKVVGSGRQGITIPGVSLENLEWRLEREIDDFRSFDIGLYPLKNDEWAAGKSGFKAVQYLAVGIPYVATPVGACAEIGEPDVTHFFASSHDDWCDALALLLTDVDRRRRMGVAGRRHALHHYTVPEQADKLARLLQEVAR